MQLLFVHYYGELTCKGWVLVLGMQSCSQLYFKRGWRLKDQSSLVVLKTTPNKSKVIGGEVAALHFTLWLQPWCWVYYCATQDDSGMVHLLYTVVRDIANMPS